MSESTFDEYLRQWREANPQRALAWLFLRHDERICYGALAALVHEWRKTMRDVREVQVAAAKLGWWREEMRRGTQGQPQHPLTQALFADPRANAVPSMYWIAPVDAAMQLLAQMPSADFATQCDVAAPFAKMVAALETRVWFGEGVESARASRVALFAQFITDTRALPAEVEHGRSPLPMNLLARHGLTIEGLAGDTPVRRAALRDWVTELRRGLADAANMAGPLTLFRAVELQNDLAALERAASAEDPLSALRAPAHGLGGLLKTWRAARKWRGITRG